MRALLELLGLSVNSQEVTAFLFTWLAMRILLLFLFIGFTLKMFYV